MFRTLIHNNNLIKYLMKTLLNMTLSEIYLDYINNFATIGFMAEHYEVEYDSMMQLFKLSRELYCTVNEPKK